MVAGWNWQSCHNVVVSSKFTKLLTTNATKRCTTKAVIDLLIPCAGQIWRCVWLACLWSDVCLLCPWEQWQSIAMSMFVCVSVCLSTRISPEPHVIFTNFSVHVAYGRGLVLLWQGDENPRGRGSFGGFLPHWQCIVQHSIRNRYKNGWMDRDAVWDDDSGRLQVPCVRWRTRSPKGKRQFWGERKKYNNVTVVFATEGIIQSPITSCSRKDHSVCQARGDASAQHRRSISTNALFWLLPGYL